LRRLLALVAALTLLAALPVTTQAGRVSRGTDHSIGFSCEGISSTGGGDLAFIGANLSDEFGAGAFIDYWAGGQPVGAPDLSGDPEQPVTLTLSGTDFTGTFAVVDGSGDPAGTAVIDAVLTPVGDPMPIDEDFGSGNRKDRVTGVVQPYAITGTLTADGLTFDLSQCFAEEATLTFFATNPNAIAARFADRSVGCDLTNTNGDSGFLFVNLNEEVVFVDAGMTSADGSVELGATGELPQAGGSVSGTLGLYDPETFEPVDGSATISMSFSATEQFSFVLKDSTFRQSVSGDLLDIEGSLSFPGGYAFNLGACVGVDATIKNIGTFPRGPKPGGKVPANDLPTGAAALKVGSKTSVSTKGASFAAEVRFECLVGIDPETGEEFVIPVANTVWYTVTGTGGPITIDTAGSDFDTVMAVFSGSPGSFETVDCVDDVPLDPIGRTLQASITFDSVAGETYYVQIGGFPQAIPYGNLRVAVR
jgi:hypothetical protein